MQNISLNRMKFRTSNACVCKKKIGALLYIVYVSAKRLRIRFLTAYIQT